MDTLPNVHPGEVLREEFLIPMGVRHYRLAKQIRGPPMRQRRGDRANRATGRLNALMSTLLQH